MVVRMALAGLLLAAILACPAGARLPEPIEKVPDRELFFVPLNGTFESPFGYRWGHFHEGIDIGAWAHTEVYSALAGQVIAVGWLRNYEGYGLVIKIRHSDGIVTMYAHLARAFVRRGDRVAEGQRIGRAGCSGSCTGVHLHFQVWVNAKLTNPLRFLGDRVRLR